jgi:hypothetical protein
MIRLRQSTASQEVALGYFLDDTDGKTPETALTIANTDIKLWKAGATAVVDKNSGGATHMAGGLYSIVLDATDTGTVGPLVIFVLVTGALPVRVECEVLSAAVFDFEFGTNAPPTAAAVTAIDGKLPAALVSGRMDSHTGAMGANVMTAAAAATDFATELNVGMATSAELTAMAATLATVLSHVDTEITTILARLPAALESGRMAASITGLGAGAVDAPTLTDAACAKIVDILFRRHLSDVEASANGDTLVRQSLIGALAKLVNAWSISGSTATVKRADGTTNFYTQGLTGTPGAAPVTAAGNS